MRRPTIWALATALVGAVVFGHGALAAAAVTPTTPTTPEPPPDALIIGFDVSVSIDVAVFNAARDQAKQLVLALGDLPIAVGLLSVGVDPAVSVGLTTDRQEVVTGIEDLERDSPTDNTLIYQSLETALPSLAGYDNPGILLFTDGRDESREPIQGVIDALNNAQPPVAVSSIYVLPADADLTGQANLVTLAEQTGGSFNPVDGSNFLASIQEQFAAAFSEVAPSVPPPVTTPPTTEAPVPTTSAPPTVAAPPPPPAPPRFLPSWVYLAAAGAVGAGLLVATVVLAGIAGRANTPQARRRRGLEAYSLNPKGPARPPPPPTRLGDNPIARTAVDLADRVVRSRNAEEPLTRRLESANLSLRPGEWLLLQMLVAAVLGLVLLGLSGGNPVAFIAGALLGTAGPWVFLLSRAQRRRTAFQNVLPDTLGLLASTLRVGYSLPQAMDSVVREGQEPIKTEFTRALVEARLGVPAERTLNSIAERVDSDDFRWVVMAIQIQREVGGNLAELLDTVAETMRERARLRRQVATLSAEGKLSAYIVGGLPIVFILYLLVASPGYLLPLVTDPIGILLLIVAAVLFAVGILGLRWAITVDV